MKKLTLAIALAVVFVAAPSQAGVVVLVEYLDVPDAESARFDAAVTGPLRQINLGRLERREIFAWYHYRSRFPMGADSEYTDVLVTVFTDFASLEDPAVSDGYAEWVHRSEVFQGVPGIRSEDYYGKVDYTHVTVDFLDEGASGREAFLTAMRETTMPRLQARAEAGTVVNWALFAKLLPRGSSRDYQYALVSRFDGFGHVETPQLGASEADHLRRSVVWKLTDIVE